jgi:hypothetical protein
MEHQRPRLKRRDPLSSKTKAATPAPADPQFVYLLRQTSLPSKRKAAFLDLAEFVSDALRATDLDGTGHLVRRLLAARDIGRLNGHKALPRHCEATAMARRYRCPPRRSALNRPGEANKAIGANA